MAGTSGCRVVLYVLAQNRKRFLKALQFCMFTYACSPRVTSMTILYNIPVLLFLARSLKMAIETTYSQARGQLKSLMDRAVNDREVVVVHRRTGGSVAMIAAEELESLMETAHLLRSSKNAERLLRALSRARSDSLPQTAIRDLQEKVGFDA
jgi:antitoxin YefM